MKLITFSYQGKRRLGALRPDGVLDLAGAYSATHGGLQAPAYLLDMLTFIQHLEHALTAAQEVVGRDYAEFTYRVDKVTLEAPLRNPGKIIGIGLNYADHARETGAILPAKPLMFAKFSSAVIGPGQAITWPAEASSQVDYEAELAVVIGAEAHRVSEEDAMSCVGGYTIINDISARDAQSSDKQWVRAKSFDTFCPMGPYFVSAEEIDDPHDLAISLRLNGQVMQNSRTSELIFRIPQLISYISHTCTLLPGDVISTGTPSGVGVARSPQVFLKPGDLVEVEIERLGLLSNPVI